MRLDAADRELMARFADLSLPVAGFDHSEHVHLAWALLASLPLLEAMGRFRTQLRAYAAHQGASGIYNETITCFYLLLIRERMDILDREHDWAGFRAANPDLFEPPKAFLERWYPGAQAFSSAAKNSFQFPA